MPAFRSHARRRAQSRAHASQMVASAGLPQMTQLCSISPALVGARLAFWTMQCLCRKVGAFLFASPPFPAWRIGRGRLDFNDFFNFPVYCR